MVQFTDDVLTVLQNFAQINSNFVYDSDKPLSTISPTKSIVAQYETDELVFPEEFSNHGIYDLNEFLTALDLAGDDTNLTFSNNSVDIKGKSGSIRYFFSRRDVLNVSVVSIKMPSVDAQFTLTQTQLNQLKKASNVFGHKKVQFVSDGSQLTANVCDPTNLTASSFSLELDSSNLIETKFVLDIDNFKFLKGDYKASYCKSGIVEFVNTAVPMKYWVAIER